MVFEKLMTSKLIYRYKLLKTKKEDNEVKAKLLLIISNFVISNLFI